MSSTLPLAITHILNSMDVGMYSSLDAVHVCWLFELPSLLIVAEMKHTKSM